MIKITTSGSWARTEKFLDRMSRGDIFGRVDAVARRGVDALAQATPKDSGLTASAWDYEIVQNGSKFTIWYKNTNVVNGFNVAVGLQYGHGTGSGGYVAGTDYINPALKPVFDKIADAVWEEVKRP